MNCIPPHYLGGGDFGKPKGCDGDVDFGRNGKGKPVEGGDMAHSRKSWHVNGAG